MMKILYGYLFTTIVFLAIDFVWLSYIARGFYVDQLGSLLLDRPNLLAALIFYLAYTGGVVFFAVAPALRAESAMIALGNGALLGLLAYGTYDMTNYATLRNWPISVTIVDMVWGAFLTSVSAYAGYMLATLFTASR